MWTTANPSICKYHQGEYKKEQKCKTQTLDIKDTRRKGWTSAVIWRLVQSTLYINMVSSVFTKCPDSYYVHKIINQILLKKLSQQLSTTRPLYATLCKAISSDWGLWVCLWKSIQLWPLVVTWRKWYELNIYKLMWGPTDFEVTAPKDFTPFSRPFTTILQNTANY